MEASLASTLYFLANLSATITLLTLAVFGWIQSKNSRIGLPFVMVTLSAALITLCSTLMLLSNTVETAYTLGRLQGIAVTIAAVSFMHFSMAYVNHRYLRDLKYLGVVYSIMLINALMMWTDPLHGLYYKTFGIQKIGSYTLITFSYGLWVSVALVMLTALLLLSIGILLYEGRTAKGKLQWQIVWILAGVLVPFLTFIAVFVADLFGTNPTYHPFSLSFVVTGLVFLRVVVRDRLLQLAPIAQSIIFDELPQPVIVVNTLGRITDINKAALALRQLSADQAIGENYQAMLPELAEKATDDDVIFHYETGASRYFECQQTPLTAGTEAIGSMIILQDITERRQSLEEIARSERRYRQIFNTTRAIKLVIHPETGQIVYANEAAVEFYGYPRATLLSMTIHDINILDDEEIDLEMQRAKCEKRNYFEFQHKLASGDIRDVDVFASPLDMPTGRMLYSIILDVTGRREAELRYRALFQQSNDAVFILDLDGKHLAANLRAAELLGYSAEEIIGLSYRDIVVVDQRDNSANVRERLIAGERIPPYERTFVRKDGSTLAGEINAEIVRDSSGHPLHIQSVVRDITERQQMEQHRFEAALQAERVTLLMNFIQNAAHEFRTPLAVINTSVHLLTRTEDMERRMQRGATVKEQVKRITRLVDMLLMMVNLESGQTERHYPLDMRAIVQTVCHEMQLSHGDEPQLIYDIAPDLPRIMGSTSQLSKALGHLLENAYQHTPLDGTITVNAKYTDTHLCITIADTGAGIAPEAQRHVFEMFWRQDTAHSTPGFGLGLAIVEKIVQLHGGTIEVKSNADTGVTFTMRLPQYIPD